MLVLDRCAPGNTGFRGGNGKFDVEVASRAWSALARCCRACGAAWNPEALNRAGGVGPRGVGPRRGNCRLWAVGNCGCVPYAASEDSLGFRSQILKSRFSGPGDSLEAVVNVCFVVLELNPLRTSVINNSGKIDLEGSFSFYKPGRRIRNTICAFLSPKFTFLVFF